MTQPNTAATEPAAHSRRTWVMIAVVIALTAFAISLVPEDEPVVVELPPLPTGEVSAPAEKTVPQVDSTKGTAKTKKPATKDTETPPAPTTGEAATVMTAGQAARAFIAELHRQGKEDPEAAVAEADKHMQAKRFDDAYLLYFYAARLGHAEAALAVATQADPGYHGSERSALSRPDIPLALKWYGQAASAGSRTAKKRLQALRSRVEQAATQGDLEAQRLVLQWK